MLKSASVVGGTHADEAGKKKKIPGYHTDFLKLTTLRNQDAGVRISGLK